LTSTSTQRRLNTKEVKKVIDQVKSLSTHF
jgi:hypothetical protein